MKQSIFEFEEDILPKLHINAPYAKVSTVEGEDEDDEDEDVNLLSSYTDTTSFHWGLLLTEIGDKTVFDKIETHGRATCLGYLGEIRAMKYYNTDSQMLDLVPDVADNKELGIYLEYSGSYLQQICKIVSAISLNWQMEAPTIITIENVPGFVILFKNAWLESAWKIQLVAQVLRHVYYNQGYDGNNHNYDEVRNINKYTAIRVTAGLDAWIAEPRVALFNIAELPGECLDDSNAMERYSARNSHDKGIIDMAHTIYRDSIIKLDKIIADKAKAQIKISKITIYVPKYKKPSSKS